jgi:hypothetical protein
LPGMAENCVQVTLGYGRTRAGRVGNGLGFNSYQLRTADAPWGGPGLEVRATGRLHHFASAQDHGTMAGRDLVRFADLATYRETPHFAQEHERTHDIARITAPTKSAASTSSPASIPRLAR